MKQDESEGNQAANTPPDGADEGIGCKAESGRQAETSNAGGAESWEDTSNYSVSVNTTGMMPTGTGY